MTTGDSGPPNPRLPALPDSELTRLRPATIFFGIWAVIIILDILGDAVPSLRKLFAFVLVSLAWLAYPLALVYSSTVTKTTSRLRGFVAFNAAIFCFTFVIRPFDGSVADRWLSAVGLVTLLLTEFAAARAVARAEQEAGLVSNRGTFGAWLSLFMFPFFGVFFIHKRHRLLEKHARTTRPPVSAGNL